MQIHHEEISDVSKYVVTHPAYRARRAPAQARTIAAEQISLHWGASGPLRLAAANLVHPVRNSTSGPSTSLQIA